MSELIEKQAVIDALLSKMDTIDDKPEVVLGLAVAAGMIKDMPAVTPAENPNKWIPVSERYPEDGQHILFSTKTGYVFEGRYDADTSAHNWLSYKDDTYAWNNVVTAWMPLPEPYKASPTGAEGSEE